jgi:hypothetical protein
MLDFVKEYKVSGIESQAHPDQSEGEPPIPPDPVIEAYKRDVDRTLLIENLKLTVEERIRNLQSLVDFLFEMRKSVQNSHS